MFAIEIWVWRLAKYRPKRYIGALHMTDIKTSAKNLSDSEVVITCEIDSVTFEKTRGRAIQKAGDGVTIPGFRKGHVPESVLIQKFGEALILEEMANIAIEDSYPEILTKHKIPAIDMPVVAVTKLAKGNPFEFTLTFPIMPEIKLPDYKKIAKEVMVVEEKTNATAEETDQALNELRRQLATKDTEGKEVLPEVDLEFAKKFGPFETVDAFKAKILESLEQEKVARLREKKRMQTMEKIADGMAVKLPKILVDGELERMVGQFRHDVEKMGMKFEDYLKTAKKTEEELRTEWNPDAEKRAKIQVALSNIAEIEKLIVPKEEIEKEAKLVLEQHKDADPARVHLHLEMLLSNEKVFQFLEAQK
jgi:FKBP-type peptidyl-prolyl cis-trans isomerase (trigger factor)